MNEDFPHQTILLPLLHLLTTPSFIQILILWGEHIKAAVALFFKRWPRRGGQADHPSSMSDFISTARHAFDPDAASEVAGIYLEGVACANGDSSVTWYGSEVKSIVIEKA